MARARRTSAWTWGTFRAVSISRTWALRSLHKTSLGGPGAVGPLAKNPEKTRPSPAWQGPRACFEDAAGRGRGAALRPGRGQSRPTRPQCLPGHTPRAARLRCPPASQSSSSRATRGVCTVRRQPQRPSPEMQACTQSSRGHMNPCAWVSTHTLKERAPAQTGTV